MKHRLVMLGVGVLVACGGWAGEAPADTPSYAEIAPAIFIITDCAGRLLPDEYESVGPTKTIYKDDRFNGLTALGVCARVSDSDEWVVVDGGVLGVENVTGEARVLPGPPQYEFLSAVDRLLTNASAVADAPASLQAIAVGLVRVTATFGDMTGSAVIEIVAE